MATPSDIGKDLNILLVDDNPEIIALTEDMLREMGAAHIHTANDGRRALDLLSSLGHEKVDVILCDWNMPDVSGIEVLKQVRSTNQTIPFLMLTGTSDADSMAECKQYRITGYLTKPFSKDELQRKMHTVAQVVAFRKKRGT